LNRLPIEEAMHKGQIHIGTSGWSYRHWAGIFYPSDLKSGDYLAYYAKHFDVSELNNSFYKIPQKSTIEKWLNVVPEHFLFCPKMSRYLSHLKKLHNPEEPLERFFAVFEPFRDRLGPILIQLPANLPFERERVAHLYELLADEYGAFHFAMEVRHESWFSEESLQLMRHYKVTLVFAQSDRFPYYEEITSKHIFLRFHGPKNLYSSTYDDDTLQAYAQKFCDWSKAGHTVWAFFNNDIHGYAFQNAAKLRQLTGQLPEH
jgi:uncharacterized protein YecE (DUF72 family)